MAKTALKNKAAAKPKFKVRVYTRCQVCAACAFVRRLTVASCPALLSPVGKYRRRRSVAPRLSMSMEAAETTARKGISPT